MLSDTKKVLLLTKAEDVYSLPYNVMNFDIVNFTIIATGDTVAATVKFLTSDQDTAPDFTAAASATNQWVATGFKNLVSNEAIAGGTGLVLSAAGLSKVSLNDAGGHKWVGVYLDWTAGSITVEASGFNTAK